ncbi:AraC family transcriptional regulator [Pseudoalteromonas citrea]|uniref:AraC family transcriptional regulator n=1 Tax=Pseudoalteromonas citrea TaxID=43655 RepID=A0A5S3XR88_9GAMM|nr:AraC family transcriptional regulator [Pseudoalteromonas citrea]TMP42545.1 AraC family transcriptional regulator [Pseudoalteromonas citrea]TMP59277.1 AraC family transcriptional regulator [Pseudoalteromonas citrea]
MPNKNLHVSFEQSKKRCVRHTLLSNEVSWSHYKNQYERLYYQNQQQHTLSMYLNGGYETHRTDVHSTNGAPGRFCLMPQDSESRWQIGVPQEFVHLYFSDNHLKHTALKVFDIDPRQVNLPERIFFENQPLEALFRHQINDSDWHDKHNTLAIEQFTDTIIVSVLQSLNLKNTRRAITGGLSPKKAKQVTDFIHANFNRQIVLFELAHLVELSEYHFCRMFKLSFAQTPQQYLMSIRIEYAKQALKTSTYSLANIALMCGFANQSHFGRNFKQRVGVTPSSYRRQL